VLEDSQSATVALVALIGQVFVAIILVVFVVRKARDEFDRVVESNHMNEQVINQTSFLKFRHPKNIFFLFLFQFHKVDAKEEV